jgi:hypothetical protein
MHATSEEKRLFVLRNHALIAFNSVIEICEQVIDKPIPPSDPLYHPLMIALYIAYGRPFTKCWGYGKLPEDSIPTKFRKLHDVLISHRNKIYAHADKDMTHEDYGPANELRVTVGRDGQCRCWTQPVQPTPLRVKDILTLAREMHRKMEYWTDRFVNQHMMKMDVEPGDYLVNTESETDLLTRRDAEQVKRERLRGRRAVSRYGTPEAPQA